MQEEQLDKLAFLSGALLSLGLPCGYWSLMLGEVGQTERTEPEQPVGGLGRLDHSPWGTSIHWSCF